MQYPTTKQNYYNQIESWTLRFDAVSKATFYLPKIKDCDTQHRIKSVGSKHLVIASKRMVLLTAETLISRLPKNQKSTEAHMLNDTLPHSTLYKQNSSNNRTSLSDETLSKDDMISPEVPAVAAAKSASLSVRNDLTGCNICCLNAFMSRCSDLWTLCISQEAMS